MGMGAQTTTNEKKRPRQRLLAAANELFYNEGTHAVGIDRVIERAGVAKGSLYYNFSGGKNDLIKEYLLGRHATWAARVDQEIAKHEEPRHKILSVFDALGTLFSEPDYRGCAFMNATAGAPENGPEIQAAANFRAWLHALLDGIVADLDVQTPGQLTDQLVILYDGAVTAAQMDHNPKAATTAKTLAAMVLGMHPSETRADHVTA
jgi:AcrR family transcriptional regulator